MYRVKATLNGRKTEFNAQFPNMALAVATMARCVSGRWDAQKRDDGIRILSDDGDEVIISDIG